MMNICILNTKNSNNIHICLTLPRFSFILCKNRFLRGVRQNMKLTKELGLLVLSICTLTTLAACGNKNASGHANQLNLMASGEMPTLDPSLATDDASLTALSNTNDGLYRIGKNAKPENALATATKTSTDGLKWTFTLRRHVKWSNGDPVTAQNFVYAWQRTNDPKTASEFAYLFSGVKNADAIQAGKASVKSLGIRAIGAHKLVITLEKPIPYFKLLLGFPVFFPQDQKVVDKYGKTYGQTSSHQVFNGPFKVTGYKGTNTKWAWVKNPTYWDKKHVKLDRINFQVVKDASTQLNLYNSNKADMTQLTGDQVEQYKHNKNYIYRPGSAVTYLQLNEKSVPALKNQKIRAALSYAIDRQQLVNNVLQDGSTAAKTFTPPKLASNPTTGQDFAKQAAIPGALSKNLAKAKTLLKQGEQESGISELKLSLLAGDTDSDKRNAQFIQSELEKLPNVKITVTPMPGKVKLAHTSKGQFQLALSSWLADYSDPNTYAIFTSDNSYNNGHWSNETYDENVANAAGKNALSPTKRFDNLVTSDQTLVKDYGVLPLFDGSVPGSGPFLQRPYVKGIVYNSAGINWNYKAAYVK